MKTASVPQSKDALSRLLRFVKAGKSVLILDRDVPVARLEPVAASALPDDVRLRTLEGQGLIRRPLVADPPAPGARPNCRKIPPCWSGGWRRSAPADAAEWLRLLVGIGF